MSAYQKTMIDELPELADLEATRHGNGHVDRPINEEKYQKFIRNTHKASPNSGMAEPYTHGIGGQGLGGYGDTYVSNPSVEHMQMQASPQKQSPMDISCQDIASHIENCKVCGKLYNSDKTLYVIIIILLSLVCILLLKRVLSV